METITLERLGYWRLYRVSYGGHWYIVPWFRVESAIVRVVREYHAAKGVGV